MRRHAGDLHVVKANMGEQCSALASIGTASPSSIDSGATLEGTYADCLSKGPNTST